MLLTCSSLDKFITCSEFTIAIYCLAVIDGNSNAAIHMLVLQTKAAKPVLGKYYREPKKSGPFPVHLIDNLMTSMSNDHYVSDTGDIVYYQTDPKLFKSLKSKSS